jgi:hypothetical protein
MEAEQVSIEDVSLRFNAHLNVEGNNRIIFSGKYGTGKSYFLNTFFEDRKVEYNKFIISPTNYVVSNNEDIFELIKVDIIKQLLFEGHIQWKQHEKLSNGDVAFLFANTKAHRILQHITDTFGKIDPTAKMLSATVKGTKLLLKEYKKFEKELNEELKLNSEQLEEFVTAFVNTKGNIYEENFITGTINHCLDEIKQNGKKNVLIIDDLDRIDPEHIFRILNVLSAHNNHWGAENKFKFDHIILVCDIDNIQKIYHHKYGALVDFEGYMDKFYSTDVFTFTNREAVMLYVDRSVGVELSASAKKLLSFILTTAVEDRTITLRKLLKTKFKVNKSEYIMGQTSYNGYHVPYISTDTDIIIKSTDFEILTVIKLLSLVWGSIDHARSYLFGRNDEKTFLSYEVDSELFNFITIPLLLADHYSTERVLSFNAVSSHNKANNFDYPVIQINGHPFQIKLRWSARNRYESNQSFFSGARPYLTSKDYEAVKIPTGKYFQLIAHIIRRFQDHGFLKPLGL